MKYSLILLVLFIPPLIFHASQGDALSALFRDTRPIYRAQPLETIYGAEAGARVDIPELTAAKSYRVESGDTWWTIAKAHKVADANALSAHNNHAELFPGMIIEIPPELMESP